MRIHIDQRLGKSSAGYLKSKYLLSMSLLGSDRLSAEEEADGSSERSLVSSRHLERPGGDTSTIINMLQNVLAEQRELKSQYQELKVFDLLISLLTRANGLLFFMHDISSSQLLSQ